MKAIGSDLMLFTARMLQSVFKSNLTRVRFKRCDSVSGVATVFAVRPQILESPEVTLPVSDIAGSELNSLLKTAELPLVVIVRDFLVGVMPVAR